MIGLRVGLTVGSNAGLAVGMSASEIGGGAAGSGLSAVTRDATSLIYTPANATEWAIVMSVAGILSGGPSLCWLMQEASGNLSDSIGTFVGTATGAPLTYRQAVAGWSRLAILGGDAGTGSIVNTDAGLPDTATVSMLIISYVSFTGTPAANRFVQVGGTATFPCSKITPTPRIQGLSSTNTVTGTANPTGVRLLETLYDVTNNRVVVSSDQEKLVVTRIAAAGKRYFLLPAFPGGYLYSVGFFGSAAELSDAQRKTLYQTLGWSIPWT
jgi:hypothetical protein